MKKIQWCRTNDCRNNPDTKGFWTSLEGRFDISPNYRGTVNADSFTVHDKMASAKTIHHKYETHTTYTVTECKEWAQRRVESEWEKRNV